jgi:damage-control phosphatase, subfamily I
MKTSLDCIPCFVRQALNAARVVSADPAVHELIVREVLLWISDMTLEEPPVLLGQRLHRRLREMTGIDDPYQAAKDYQNQMAQNLLSELRTEIDAAPDPLAMAVRLAIAGNVIDMGVNGNIAEADVRQSIQHALAEPFFGEWEAFCQAAATAQRILYLADNAGEIVFDRLLIEQLSPARITLAVRGAPVLNDATLVDARAVGLHKIVEVIDNGSDVAGTMLNECSPGFLKRFSKADVILAKGQGNFETLSDEPFNMFFLFKAKCSVIAAHAGVPIGTHVLARSNARIMDWEVRHDSCRSLRQRRNRKDNGIGCGSVSALFRARG